MKIFSVCECIPGTGILGPRATVAVLRLSVLVPGASAGCVRLDLVMPSIHSTYSLCLLKQFKVSESQVKLSKSKQTESELIG